MRWILFGLVLLVPWLLGVGWLAATAWAAGRDLVERRRGGAVREQPARRSPVLDTLRSAAAAVTRPRPERETAAQARFRRWQQGLTDDDG